jgi:Skp family chaperone for outer membrane proteins
MSMAGPLVLSLTIVATSAMAQTQAQVPAPNGMAPPVPGVCLFARDVALGATKAGVAANARMRQLSEQVRAELAPEQQIIATEDNVLKTSGSQMAPADRQRRAEALQKRAAAFAELQKVRAAQIQQTRANAIAEILKPMDAVLTPVATSRRCAVVFERATTYGFNAAMDLTPAVIQQVDARLPTLTFNLAPPPPAPR